MTNIREELCDFLKSYSGRPPVKSPKDIRDGGLLDFLLKKLEDQDHEIEEIRQYFYNHRKGR